MIATTRGDCRNDEGQPRRESWDRLRTACAFSSSATVPPTSVSPRCSISRSAVVRSQRAVTRIAQVSSVGRAASVCERVAREKSSRRRRSTTVRPILPHTDADHAATGRLCERTRPPVRRVHRAWRSETGASTGAQRLSSWVERRDLRLVLAWEPRIPKPRALVQFRPGALSIGTRMPCLQVCPAVEVVGVARAQPADRAE
jgi:hypothetical protein